MPKVNYSEIFNVSPQKCFEVISFFEGYPEWIDEVQSCSTETLESGLIRVHSIVELKKCFEYSLDMKLVKPLSLEWTLNKSDIFKKNTGSWKFTKVGEGQTKVEYTADIEFKIIMPKFMVKSLIQSSLPRLFKQFKNKVK